MEFPYIYTCTHDWCTYTIHSREGMYIIRPGQPMFFTTRNVKGIWKCVCACTYACVRDRVRRRVREYERPWSGREIRKKKFDLRHELLLLIFTSGSHIIVFYYGIWRIRTTVDEVYTSDTGVYFTPRINACLLVITYLLYFNKRYIHPRRRL